MYFVIDIEATCCEKRNVRDKNEIIEIGLVVCKLNGEKVDTFQSFVRPTHNTILSSFCKNLTNIEQEWIDNSESLNFVLQRLIDWADKKHNIEASKTVWFSFGDWDNSCLIKDCNRHKLNYPFGAYVNLKRLYTEYSDCEQCGLRDAIELENLKWEGQAHRAIWDAINAAKLAKFLVTPDSLSY